MKKTILVPIDFSVASLNTLKMALESNPYEKVRAILLFAEYLNDSIVDLLFYSQSKLIDKLITNEFKEALEIIKNHFKGTLDDVAIMPIHGDGKNYWNAFLEVNKINEIYIPKNYKLKTANKSFDLTPLIKSTNKPIFEMEWEANYKKFEQEKLTALFLNNKL